MCCRCAPVAGLSAPGGAWGLRFLKQTLRQWRPPSYKPWLLSAPLLSAKSLTFSGLVENALVGKKFSSPNSKQNAPKKHVPATRPSTKLLWKQQLTSWKSLFWVKLLQPSLAKGSLRSWTVILVGGCVKVRKNINLLVCRGLAGSEDYLCKLVQLQKLRVRLGHILRPMSPLLWP